MSDFINFEKIIKFVAKDPISILLIVALLLILLFVIPTQLILLLTAVTISICIGFFMDRVVFPRSKIKFTNMEQTILSGLASGTMGFLSGVWLGELLSEYSYI